MPRGGKRTPGEGKKLGRPKVNRPVDGNIARKIKARVKAEELWVFLIQQAAQKAKETKNTSDLRQALEYLDDRDMGRCNEKDPTVRNPQLNADPEQRIAEIFALAESRAGRVSKPN